MSRMLPLPMLAALLPDDVSGEWHAGGTRHVDHDHIVVAIRGTLADDTLLLPGATPPFTLAVISEPAKR